jgi:hypothetical protein
MAEKRRKLIVTGPWPYEKRKLRPAKPIHMPRKTLIKTSIGSMEQAPSAMAPIWGNSSAGK